jgi:hypothetical protein
MAYFFLRLQGHRKAALFTSLVIQLSHQSNSFCDILVACYKTHKSGSQQPSDRTLTQCLVDMLRFSQQVPVYLIFDAIDECPNTIGISSSPPTILMPVSVP